MSGNVLISQYTELSVRVTRDHNALQGIYTIKFHWVAYKILTKTNRDYLYSPTFLLWKSIVSDTTFMPYENIHLTPAGKTARANSTECRWPHYLSQHNVAGNCFFQVLFALAITINSLLDTLFAQM